MKQYCINSLRLKTLQGRGRVRKKFEKIRIQSTSKSCNYTTLQVTLDMRKLCLLHTSHVELFLARKRVFFERMKVMNVQVIAYFVG